VAWVVLGHPQARGQDKAAKPKEPARKAEPPALPASLSGFSDAGVFHLYKDEEQLATITFTWKRDGSFEDRSTLSYAGQTVKQSTKITPDKDGRWQTIVLTSPRGDTTVTREGGIAKRVHKDETVTVKLKPGALLFDNFGPALMSQAVRAYDRAKGGKQAFAIFVLPGVNLEATFERKDVVERSVGGKDQKFMRYTYGLVGTDIIVWADDEGKVLLGDVPSQRAAYVREGYEILRKAPETDPLLSRPDHKVRVDRDVGVPMRDGVRLATTIYRPEGGAKVPVILIRTPYKKEMSDLQGLFYARRGYAVAIQDCRGRFASPGTWEPFFHEPNDGHDAVEWLATRPWCSGKVGMIGGSYVGWVQWWAASQHPPHLTTIIPNVSPPDPFYNIPYEYGAFFLWAAVWWADVLESAATADLSGAAMERIGEKKYHTLLRSLPVIDLDKKVLGKENPYWRRWIEHPVNDSYWERANFLEHLKDVNIPVFHQSGWFDGDGIGSKLNYAAMAAAGHPNQKLVLGPWGHTDQSARRHEDRDFGPQALMDLQRAYLRWFDHWLKGVPNGIDKEPLVSIFVMGSNRWLTGDVYPLPETRFEKWYLAGGGKANTSKGDGRLSRDAPPADSAPDRYTYDPGDPTPDPGFYEEPEEKGAKKPKSSEEQAKKRKAYHDEVTNARKDILVYVTEPFKEPYTFAGPLSAVLYASSSARDTDWFVRLMEVDEKGKLFDLVEGKLRARFRESSHNPSLLEPGKVYEYKIDLWQTGITVPAGRRLRVEVASASFPMFSRNLNTGGHNETETRFVPAEQVIYHSKEYPSHLLLPMIPDGRAKKAEAGR
jgi:putative CocE/NonD family hydrolase